MYGFDYSGVFKMTNLLTTLQPTRTIKWQDFFETEIKEEPLVLFQVEPDRMVRNARNLEGIVNGLYALQRSFFKRIHYDRENNVLMICLRNHISYEIYYENNKITFRYVCPATYESFFKQKIQNAFPRSTIKKILPEEDVVYHFSRNARYTQLIQKEHFFKSLAGDFRTNAPLPSLISVVHNLQNGDRALLQFIFNPLNDLWKPKAIEAWMKHRRGEKVEKSESGLWGVLDWFFGFIDRALEVFDMIVGVEIEKEPDLETRTPFMLYGARRINSLTTQKTNYDGFDVHIRLLAESEDKVRAEQSIKSIMTALKDIASDNELVLKHGIKRVGYNALTNIRERRIPMINFDKNIWCSKEVAQIVQMPGARLQEEYRGIINSIETREVALPSKLAKGNILLGKTKYRGKNIAVYWDNSNPDYFALPKVWQGFMRSGKTTAGKNFIRETQVHGYWNMVIDVNDGSLVDDVVSTLPKDYPKNKIIVLDFTNPDYIFRLGFNEALKLAKMGAGSKQADRAFSKVADTLSYFLNATTAEPLSDRMTRYFISAVRLCLLNNYCGVEAFKNCLTDYRFREELIIKSQGKIRDKVIQDMKELNEYDQDGNVKGAKSSQAIVGILDRLNRLIQTDILEDCFMGEPNMNIDFRKWFDQGYFVGIKANKDAIGGFETCNILITFLIQKAWSAILSRYDNIQNQKDFKLGFITMDEPHSFPLVCKILTGAIRESAKWRCGFNFMVHDLDDLGIMLPKLIDAGGNFILFPTSEKNYKKIESILHPFTIEDALQTKEYHAIHIVNCGGERIVFDANALLPPTERYPIIDRQHVTQECWNKYGN